MPTERDLFDDVRKAARQFANRAKFDRREMARLGKLNATGQWELTVPNRPNWVYVRIIRGQAQVNSEALNMSPPVRLVPDIPVFIDYEPTIQGYQITGLHPDNQYEAGDLAPSLSVPQFVFDAAATPAQLQVGLTTAHAGLWVQVEPFTYQWSGVLYSFPGGFVDLTANVPGTSGKHRWVAVVVDPSTNTLAALDGADYDLSAMLTDGEAADIDYDATVPLRVYELRYGQTSIDSATKNLDVRLLLDAVGDTGGSVGAPADAQYLTLATHASLTAERTLAAGDGLSGSDAGAGAAYTLSANIEELTEDTAPPGTAFVMVSEGGVLSKVETANLTVDATKVAYVPGGPGYWDPDPTEAAGALDDLVSRVVIIEGQVISITADEVGYTPTTGADWPDPDPTDVLGGLDDAAARIQALEDAPDPAMPIGCRLYHNDYQSIPDATATKLTWTSERYDPNGMHTGTTGDIVIPAAGLYSITLHVLWDYASDVGIRKAWINVYDTGDRIIALDNIPARSDGEPVPINLATNWYAGAGNVVSAYVYQNSGDYLEIDPSACYTPEITVQRLA